MRARWTALLLLGAMWCRGEGEPAQPALPGGASYTAVYHKEGYEAKVQLPVGIGDTAPKVEALDPVLNGKYAAPVLGNDQGVPMVVSVLIKKPDVRPGSFPFRLTVYSKKDEPLSYGITIVVPAATITLPAGFQWKAKAWCLWDCASSIPVVVRPDQYPWHLTGVKPSADLPLRRDNNPLQGALVLERNDAAKDETGAVHFDLKGTDLPYGTAAGQFRIYADQLAQPATFAVTVIRQLWEYWLLVPILLGLVAGYYLRKKNDDEIARLQFEIQAKHLLAQLDRLIKTKPDESYVKTLNEIRASIVEQFNSGLLNLGFLQGIPALVKAATDKLKERQDAVVQAANAFRALLGERYRVPPGMREAMKTARAEVEKALQTGSNAGLAEKTLAEAQERFLALLAGEAREWFAGWRKNQDLVEAVRPFCNASDKAWLEAKWNPAQARAEELDKMVKAPRLKLEQSSTILNAVHYNDQEWAFVEQGLPAIWKQFGNDLRLEARLRSAALPAEWTSLAERIGQALEEERAPVADLAKARQQLRDWLREQLERIRDAKEKEKALAELRTDNFLAAVARLESDKTKGESEKKGVAAEPAAPVAAKPSGASTAPESLELPLIGRPTVPEEDVTLDELETELEHRLGWKRWFAIGSITVAGFLVMRTTYAGSAMDYVVAFFWAFSTDLAVDNAVTLLKGKFPKTT